MPTSNQIKSVPETEENGLRADTVRRFQSDRKWGQHSRLNINVNWRALTRMALAFIRG